MEKANFRKLVLKPGDSVSGDYNTIESPQRIMVYGNFNKIYTNNSLLSGNFNKIYGNGNTVNGNFNKIHGINNTISGKSCKENNVAYVSSSRNGTVNRCGGNVITISGGDVMFQSTTQPSFVVHQASGAVNHVDRVVQHFPVIQKVPTSEELQHDEVTGAEDAQETTCVICLERKRKCVIRPCRHFSLCVACSIEKLSECPVCRVKIVSIERVFT